MFWDQRVCAPLRVERVQNEWVESETKGEQSFHEGERSTRRVAQLCFRVTHFDRAQVRTQLPEPRLDLERHHWPRIPLQARIADSRNHAHCKSLVQLEACSVLPLDVVATGSTSSTRGALRECSWS